MKYAVSVESPAGLSAGAVIAAVYPPSSTTFCLRKLLVGGRGASSPGRVSVAVAYAQSSGTPSDAGPANLQPTGTTSAHIGGAAHGAFSADPTPGANLYELSFSTESDTQKLEWGYGDFACQDAGGSNGILLYSVDAAPAGYLFTVSFETEEI